MLQDKKTATYRFVEGNSGNCYQFYCDLSGSLVYTTEPSQTAFSEEELMRLWENEAKKNFNKCHKCGNWIIAAMYNPDVLNCVKCSPIEDVPNFCPQCGVKINSNAIFCHVCGSRLLYGGEPDDEKTK